VNRSVNPVAQIRKVIRRGVCYTERELELLAVAPVKTDPKKLIFRQVAVKKSLDIPVKGQ
jgi:hypothetical protein